MPYSLELGPPSNPDRILTADDLFSVDIAKPHTALADFDISIPWDRQIDDHVLKAARIYHGSDLLFRGYLRELDWDQAQGNVRLNGPGIGDDLKDSAIERSWTNTATHVAIQDVWDQDTGFDATVRDPSTSVVADDKIVIDATTQSELRAIIDQAGPTAPIVADANDDLALAQSLFMGTDDFGTGERLDDQASGKIENSNGQVKIGYLGGQFGQSGDLLDFDFDLDYDIPDGDVGWAFRYFPYDQTGDNEVNDLPQMSARIDGTEVQGFGDRWGSATTPGNPSWFKGEGSEVNGLAAGSHTFSVEQTKDTDDTYDEVGIGLMVVYDTRWSYNFDNTVSTTGTGDTGDYNYLDGPELYPNAATIRFDTVETNFNVIEITLDTAGWTDTGGDQAVAVSLDGGKTWIEAANATSVTESQPNNIGKTVDTRVTLDRWGSGQQRTPDQGFKGQKLGSVTVDYDGSDLSVIVDNTFRGSPLKILTDLHEKADYRFAIDHAATDSNGDLTKRVESFETGTGSKPKDWTVVNRSPRQSFTGYANQVTVYGREAPDGSRPKATVQDDTEIAEIGETIPYWEIVPDVKTVDQARQQALDLLTSKVKERDQKGDIEAIPTNILPGYSYPVDWFADGNPTTTPLERVQISESADSLRSNLAFVVEDDVTGTVIEQGRSIDETRKGI